mmetsp:Transcript_7162/g.10911  ORF Transcript_7162/g.10911 Transcript_7162/m.10911 type:complete len:287 (+) Transcript_7162:45-905(+)|eukprot:CAMPEP_0167767280 /NCGR_PEP_ID=MMETSP0110_2-20121227/15945_1 /TAXON_ID=629695 /ORGANISM="Gymnochlora sp., Strain CCMP2014" /LENGTH=286 /DNA_ID=CAMNT_0007655667 /DNA_START=42 /DNA_END=902 /DNA_ORIENTATION=+
MKAPLIRRPNTRKDLGHLGGVLVGLLVLTAIGGAYSLRAYPFVEFVGSASYAQQRSFQYEAPSASLDSFQVPEDAAKVICHELLGAFREYTDLGGLEAMGGVLDLDVIKSEAIVRQLFAFVGTKDLTRAKAMAAEGGNFGTMTAMKDIMQDFKNFSDSRDASAWFMADTFQDVDCDLFAQNVVNLRAVAEDVARNPQNMDPREMEAYMQSIFGGNPMLGASIGAPIFSFGSAVSNFGLWLHRSLKKMLLAGLARLPNPGFGAPRRRRGKVSSQPPPQPRCSCLGCC